MITEEYEKDIKLSAVHLVKSKYFSAPQVAELLNISDCRKIYRWIKEYNAKGVAAFDTDLAVLPSKELKKLIMNLEDARIENDILRKTVIYYEKHKKAALP